MATYVHSMMQYFAVCSHAGVLRLVLLCCIARMCNTLSGASADCQCRLKSVSLVLIPEGLIQKQDPKDALISRAW